MKDDFNENDDDKFYDLRMELAHLKDVNQSLQSVIDQYEDLLDLLNKDVPNMPKIALHLIRQALFISLRESPK